MFILDSLSYKGGTTDFFLNINVLRYFNPLICVDA
jgi:hypothetical protein